METFKSLADDPAPRFKHAGGNRPRTLAFPNFKLSTRFPNNFCLQMDKGKKNSPQVFVLTDIVKHVQGNYKYRLIGQKFMKLDKHLKSPSNHLNSKFTLLHKLVARHLSAMRI